MRCKPSSQPQQKPIGKPQGSKSARAVLDFYAGLKSRGGVISEAKEVEAALSREFGLALVSAAHAPVLSNYSKVESLLATVLGFKSTVLGAVDLAMTDAGDIRYLLQTKALEAKNLLQIAALNKSLPKIRELSGEFAAALPSIDKARVEELLHDHIVIGQFPKLHNIYDSPVVQTQLAQRYQEHTSRLLAEGVSVGTIKKMDELAGEISQSFDNARILAGKYGLDVKTLTNGGYFPLQAQETIGKLLDAAQETSRSNKSKQVFDTARMLNASRYSTMPAVLDLDKTAAVLGMPLMELAMTLTNPGGISAYLRKKFSASELQKLYDNGTLTQIPALSDELTTFFAEELDLPIKGLGDAIVLDPERAIKKYNAELVKATENAATVQTALEEGIKYGWVLDAGQIAGVGNKKDYVKVGSDKLFQELFRSDKLREGISNLYIHRTVKDQLNALTEANTSLLTLGHIGGGLQAFLKFAGFTKRTMIFAAGLPYIGRVFGQNAISLNAATGSKGMLYYANGLAEVARATTSKEGSGALSSELFASVGGKDFSIRELFDTTFLRRSVDNLSITGDKIEPETAQQKLMDAFDPVARERFFRHMEVYHERYGSPATGKVGDRISFGLEFANNTFKIGYEQLAKANQYLDFAARWTAVRTIALDPGAAGKQKWKDIDELLRYTDEYFNVNADVGSLGKSVGQYLVPFASFALVAPGVTLRHAIRHPWRYARMMSLYAQANSSNDLTDAEVSQFQKDSYPVFIGKDPITGKRFSVNPGTIDSFLDTTTWARENFEKAARAFGQPSGSVKEIVESKIDPTLDITNAVSDVFKRTYLTAGVGAAFFGIDPKTGERFNDTPDNDTLLNIGITKRVRAAIVETLPVLRALDQKLPTAIVGASTVQDPVSLQVTREGTPGLFGNIPTSGGTPKPKNIEAAGIVGWILNTGGLTLAEIDPKANLIRNYNDFGYIGNDLSNARNRLEAKVGSIPDGLEKERLLEERTRLLQIEGLLEYNQLLVNRLAIEKGYPIPLALKMMRQQLTTARDVPQEARLEFFRQQTEGAK